MSKTESMKIPQIKDNNLFIQAFTHRSYLNETRDNISSNERLEFLGDSIISFVVSDFLYKSYPKFNEGELTNLRSLMVNTESLAEVSESLGFGNLLKLSKGEEILKGRQNKSLLADSFEAFVGALFTEQGIDVVSEFLKDVLLPKAEDLAKKTLKDPKSLLQEMVQSRGHTQINYQVIAEQGPAHSKTFTINVLLGEKILGTGKGKSKQDAEKSAAENALSNQSIEQNKI